MKKELRPIAFLKDPPALFIAAVWAAALIFIAAAIALTALSVTDWYTYIVYVFAAVFLTYSIYLIVRGVPKIKEAIIAKAKKHAFTDNIVSSYGFRTAVFFLISFAINVGFAVFNGVMGIVTRSAWYGIMSCYYIFLSALRGGLLAGGRKIKKLAGGDGRALNIYQLKLYRLCGISLFVLELALAAAVTLMILSERPTAYSEIMAITCAAYTFYKITFAIINIRKAGKLRDPVLQSYRNINLTDAAVSLLSLQVTLVAVFSDEQTINMNALNAVTGFVVCALTIVLGALMIVNATVRLKKINQANAEK